MALTEVSPLPTDAPEPRLEPGTRVEVRRKFDQKWANGFEVASAEAAGYRLRRLSDLEVLPVPFPFDDVRKARKRDYWWY